MVTGYPRFFIHKSIDAFASHLAARYGGPGSRAMLFPTRRAASRCMDFVRAQAPKDLPGPLGILECALNRADPASRPLAALSPCICALVFPTDAFPYAKQYWQHSGDGVSSRRAEFCHALFRDALLEVREDVVEAFGGIQTTTARPPSSTKASKGPRRYQRPITAPLDTTSAGSRSRQHQGHIPDDAEVTGNTLEAAESSRFLEERFGRNLATSLVSPAKSAIRRRIAGALRGQANLAAGPPAEMGASSRGVPTLRERDVYLFPCGMNAIFHTHRMLMAACGRLPSICFGFSYVDTLKILQKFGPGCQFYPRASATDLQDLEARLAAGERYLALFCEFPNNPILTCPDLPRIRHLADKYDFAVVVDETVGTFENVDVLPFADVVVSSLTKIFSGDCNVMGGSAIVNPRSQYYDKFHEVASEEHEDTFWAEDVVFMERNSRDFAVRIDRVNVNAEAICDVLLAHPTVKKVYYPKYSDTRHHYDTCRRPNGGYGGLLSVVFHHHHQAVTFYDSIQTAKGPSLGTNFTLASPYVLLAHYQELEWVSSFGIEPDLVRISVGLEETKDITAVFTAALAAALTAGPDQ